MTSEICFSCITRHPEHNKIKLDKVESEEALEGVFEFSVQETSKDRSQNGKRIFLKPEQEDSIRVQSVHRMSLRSIYQILAGDSMVTTGIGWITDSAIQRVLNTPSFNMGLQILLPQSRSHQINIKTVYKHHEIYKYLSFFKLDASRKT